MDAEAAPATVTVPIKVPAPAGHAPPTLAEPAGGPVAELSGVLHSEEHPTEDTTTATATATATATDTLASTNGVTEAPTADDVSTETPTTAPTDTAHPAEAAAPAAETTSTQDAAAEADTTPASSKKPSNGKRKSTGGVPEHKNKKLNKKKSMPKITHLDAKPGDYFFARLKTYPPWPSIICDEEMLPSTLLQTRPVTTKRPDGTYNEAYADGGKKVAERTYPIMFLHTNEFAWIQNTDLTPLKPEDVADFAEKGKSKQLLAAYRVAAENNSLQHYKDVLMEHARALQEDTEAKEARDAEKAAKAEKKRRKSEVTAGDDDVEMEDVDSADTKKASKKRKKAAEDGDDEEKPAKTPKTTKLKLTSPKDPATAEKKAKEPKTAKPKGEKRKSKAADDDGDVPMEEESWDKPKPLDPVEERKSREKEVLFLRHKLQKGFLSRDQAPQESEMLQMSHYIKKLENYEDLEVGIIRATKINKVLKALIKLNTIPKDEEYNFRGRAVAMLGQWNKLLGAEPEGDEKADDKADATTNGVHDEKEDKAEKAEDVEQSVEKTEEPEAKPAPEAKDTVTADTVAPSVEDVKPAEHQSLGISMKSPNAAETAATVTTDGPVTAAETDARTATD